jgi:hypothetical protein
MQCDCYGKLHAGEAAADNAEKHLTIKHTCGLYCNPDNCDVSAKTYFKAVN